MARELGPQNLEGLSIRLEKLGKVTDHANRLVVNPGGADWQQNLQIDKYSGATFLRNLVVVGKETQIIKKDLLPSLEREKKKLVQTIALIQSQEDLKQITQLAQQEIIPKELLKRAEEEFSSIKVEAPPQEVSPPQADTGVGEKELYKYTTTDIIKKIVAATGITEMAADSRIRKHLHENPDIKPIQRYIPDSRGAHKTFFFTEKQKDSIIAAASGVKRRTRRSRSQQQTPITPAKQEVSIHPNQIRVGQIVFGEIDDIYITLDGRKIFLRGSKVRTMLKELAEAGEEGVNIKKLQEEDLANGVDPKLARPRVRANIARLRDSINGIGFLIPNIPLWPKQENRAYRLIREVKDSTELPPEKLAQVENLHDGHTQTRALALPFEPLTIDSLVARASQTKQPLTQVPEEKTVFVAEPESPNVVTLVPKQEDFVILPDGSTIHLFPKRKAILEDIIAAGEKGISTGDLAKPDIDTGIDERTANNNVRQRIQNLRKDLIGTGFVILASEYSPQKGQTARYSFRRQERTPPDGEITQEGGFMEDQADKDERPELTDFSPLPGTVVRPVRETISQSERITRRRQIGKVIARSGLEIIAKLQAGTSIDVNPNIRVTIGHHLPEKTSIPQIFGSNVSTKELNEYVINFLSYELNKLWNHVNAPTNNVSEEGREIAIKIVNLRKKYKTVEQVVREVRAILKN